MTKSVICNMQSRRTRGIHEADQDINVTDILPDRAAALDFCAS